MTADRDRGVRRQKQKRAKDAKRAGRRAGAGGAMPPSLALDEADTVPVVGDVLSSAPALHWTFVGDAADHPRTDEVVARLEAVRQRNPGLGHGDRMVVTLEAPDAEPVIEVVALGLDVFTEVITELRLLGLRDRLEGQEQASATVHAAFR
jgi:hypothetical protein